MALIYDDQIEEVGLEELLILLLPALPYQLLIEGEVDLVGSDPGTAILPVVDLVDGLRQWLEVLLDRLIYEYIAIRQIEHLLHQPRLEQAIDDLEGGIGLPCTCRHHEEETLLSLCDSTKCVIDSITLVVARGIDILPCAEGLIDHLELRLR